MAALTIEGRVTGELARTRVALRGRLGHTARIRGGFPGWASAANGRWVTSAGGDWTAGYQAGGAWLLGQRGDGRRIVEALRPMVRSTSVFRGFVFYYGAAVGDLLAVDAAARRLALAAADALAAARIPGGIVPHDDHDRETGDANLAETSIDAVGPTVGLLAHAGTVGGRTDLSELAVRHLRWHLAALVRDDGSVAHSATLNDDGVVVRTFTASQGLHAGSTWARAQAWALLAAGLGARWLPPVREEIVRAARPVADWWAAHVPADGIPRWDFAAPPGDPLDTSAAAIAVVALLKLAALEPDPRRATRYERLARGTVAGLCGHVTPVGAGDQRPAGMLVDGCYHRPRGLAVADELIWGDVHLLEALEIVTGHLHPLRI